MALVSTCQDCRVLGRFTARAPSTAGLRGGQGWPAPGRATCFPSQTGPLAPQRGGHLGRGGPRAGWPVYSLPCTCSVQRGLLSQPRSCPGLCPPPALLPFHGHKNHWGLGVAVPRPTSRRNLQGGNLKICIFNDLPRDCDPAGPLTEGLPPALTDGQGPGETAQVWGKGSGASHPPAVPRQRPVRLSPDMALSFPSEPTILLVGQWGVWNKGSPTPSNPSYKVNTLSQIHHP